MDFHVKRINRGILSASKSAADQDVSRIRSFLPLWEITLSGANVERFLPSVTHHNDGPIPNMLVLGDLLTALVERNNLFISPIADEVVQYEPGVQGFPIFSVGNSGKAVAVVIRDDNTKTLRLYFESNNILDRCVEFFGSKDIELIGKMKNQRKAEQGLEYMVYGAEQGIT